MRMFKSKATRMGAIGAAALLGVTGLGVAAVATPAYAGTTPVPTNEYYSFAGPTGFAQVATVGAASSPTSASQGSNFVISNPGGSQAVPTTNSGVPVNYISGNAQYYEIPAGTAYVSSAASGPLTWTGGPGTGGIPASGSAPISITECTTATQAGCTAAQPATLVSDSATATYSGYAGPAPTLPYLEVSTGTTQIPAGSTLTLPTVDVTLQATGAVGSTINWSQFEFDTNANVTLFGHAVTAAVVGWSSGPLYTGAAYTGALPLPTGLAYAAPVVLTSTTIGAPAPYINVSNATPINSSATGVVLNVTGANWTASTSGTLAFSGCPAGATCADTGTFTTNASGAVTGTITFGANEQLATSQSPITVTITATAGTESATTPVTVNPYQAFAATCSIGKASGATCSINQTISATVSGTALTISEVTTAPNGTNEAVTLSPVTLGLGAGTNNQQFDQSQGLLNTVVVSDDRGTLGGWSVTGQMGGDFTNGTPVGPTADNVIPADFLTWQPAVALETAGTLPANNANTIGCPDQTPAPTGFPSCTGPSALPAVAGAAAGSAGVNGTGAGTGGVATMPAEVTAGHPAVLNNGAGSPAELCATATGAAPGGGGGVLCEAGLSLAIPPYVAAGTYSATMNIVVIGL